jgi:cell wall-associated NlpC family hydrolase
MAETVPAWTAGYVGLPFRAYGRDRTGLDCWGLCRLVLAERFGREIPAHDDIGFERACDRAALAAFMEQHKTNWNEVPAKLERPGDVLLLRMMGHPIHVAVVVGKGWMLHIEDGIDACLERYDGAKWSRRVVGFYRHAG